MWNSIEGKRKQGRPKATWRRTVEKEIKAIGLSWIEAEMPTLANFHNGHSCVKSYSFKLLKSFWLSYI